MAPSSVPTIQTDRLILRPLQMSDAEAYEKEFAVYELISQFSASVPWPYPQGGVAEFFRTTTLPTQGTTRWSWGIFLKESPDKIIGAVELIRDPQLLQNRGFWLGKNYWGKGYMSEAINPVVEYAFAVLGFEKLILANAAGNQRSRRIKEKEGAELIRIAPAQFVDPQYTQHEVWELTKENWLKTQSSSD